MSEVSRGHSKRAKPIRLRCYAWKQWKTGKRRFAELRRLGISKDLAAQTAGSRKRYWHISRSPAQNMALSRAFLIELGLPLLLEPEPKV
jgi:RNA-directed DNA polymerase